MPKQINLLGQKIGKLTVIERLGKRYRKNSTIKTDIWWLSKCECGKTKESPTSHLTAKNTKSCGCLIKENGQRNIKKAHEANKLPPGVAGFNAAYFTYKYSARAKKFPFELDKEFVKKLFLDNCYYCGAEPKNCVIRRNNDKNLLFKYNGIDRIDSNKGYVNNNVRTCCAICNWMKNNMTETDFYNHINRIYNYRNEMLENTEKNVKEVKEKFKNE